jgi:hypothetical protein
MLLRAGRQIKSPASHSRPGFIQSGMRPTKPDLKRSIAREDVRTRRRNLATPPLVRSKRNRSANQEDRFEDFGGRKRRSTR